MGLEFLKTVHTWAIQELTLQGPTGGNPFRDVELHALFRAPGREIRSRGFYDGEGVYKIRVMPDAEGEWSFAVSSSAPELNGLSGVFSCIKALPGVHGPVRVANTFHFAYADGTPYIPMGTTCYAWTHQPVEREERTLATLARSPFNKIRMCILPKWYEYNHDEPPRYPFEGSLKSGWDFARFNVDFFRHLELRVGQLADIGIEADLILFHPYEWEQPPVENPNTRVALHWGFSAMGAETDDRYLAYVVARLSAFRNVWWSLANEWDLMERINGSKTQSDWERLGRYLRAHDPHQHVRSIHNCRQFYDHSAPWITHCSIQRQDVYKTAELTDEWRLRWNKPVVIDECAYEGNISHGWGSITGPELVRRCWEGAVRGGYVGHGETYLNPEEILWWSKGDSLVGESPARLGFLRRVLEEGPQGGITPVSGPPSAWDLLCGGQINTYYLFYFGFNQPLFRVFSMPPGVEFKVDVIDTWEMTVTTLPGLRREKFRIELPGRQFMAVRMRAVFHVTR